MNRWRRAAGASAHDVSVRPELWVPGALAWLVAIGWLPLIVAVARPPSVSDLTFLGARLVTSGAWPWSAALIAAGLLSLIALGFAAVALANASLIATVGARAFRFDDALRLLRISAVAAIPAAIALGFLLLTASIVAPGQFNAPDPPGGPVVSTLLRLVPQLAVTAALALAALAISAVGGRIMVTRGVGMPRAIRQVGPILLRPAVAIHLAASVLAGVVLIVLATMLLGVLWAPIGSSLGAFGDFDLATGLLLIGFVAVWLCIVLAGGALHAWSAVTWSRILAAAPPGGI